MLRSVLEAELTLHQALPGERREVAAELSQPGILNQSDPEPVAQALSGEYDDGTGRQCIDHDHIDFLPTPWPEYGGWILSQQQRWKQLCRRVDYREVVEHCFDAATREVATALGFVEPGPNLEGIKIFRVTDPFAYMRSQPFCAFAERGETEHPPIEYRIARLSDLLAVAAGGRGLPNIEAQADDAFGALEHLASDLLKNIRFAQDALQEQKETLERTVKERVAEIDQMRRAAVSIAEDAEAARQTAEASRTQYEQVVSMISDVVWRYEVDSQGQFVASYISPVADRLLGLPAGTIGDSFDKYFAYIHPGDLPSVRETLFTGLSTPGKDLIAQYRMCKADGTTLWICSKGSVYLQPDGHVAAFGTTTDITERKRAEEAAKLDENRANALLELSQMTDRSAVEIANHALESAIKLTGSTIGYLAFTNEDETVLTMHYWSSSAMLQCAMIDKPLVYPVKDTGLWGEAVRQRKAVITNDYAAPNLLKKGTPSGHVRITRHMNIPLFDGSRIVAVAGVGNKAEDYQDDDVRQLTLFMDGMWRILCRKRAEEALRENEAMLSCILDSLPLSIFWKNHECVYLGCNETFARGTHFRPQDIVGKTDFDLAWSREDSEAYRADDREVMTSGRAKIHIVERQHRVDGTCIWLDTTKMPLLDAEGNVYGVVGIYDDVTQRKQMEDELHKARDAAEAATRAKGEFLANMSHEIRTPMTSILGYTDLLTDDSLSAIDRKLFMATVRRNGEHLLQLINDILDLSKIESGKMAMDLGPCHLPSTVADVASMMRPRAEQHRNTLEVRYTGPLPETIHTDGNRLRQVIVNLVGNAVKFTENGNIRIAVSFLPQWRLDQSAVSVEVRDTGIGIRQKSLASLFQPFTQAESSATRKYGGTGLGLAISRQIVAALGGELTVRSSFGEGSTFTVTIPTGDISGVSLLQSPGEVICEDEDGIQWTPGADILRGMRVLLAEDSIDNQELLRTVLGNVGAEVEVVENGRLAIERAQAGNFDVVLMDMNMPEMDGYEATRRLRDRGYSRPILALTANAMSGDCEHCLSAGCNAHLAKPIDRKQLIEAVAQYTMSKASQSDAPTASPSPATSPGRSNGISSQFAGDPQLTDILPGFVERLPTQLESLCKALEEERLEDAERLAHRLKGAGGSYGYPTLSEVAKSLELAAKARDLGGAAAALAGIKEVCTAIQAGWAGDTAGVGQV
jgi:PAS domain S-box-containing protein